MLGYRRYTHLISGPLDTISPKGLELDPSETRQNMMTMNPNIMQIYSVLLTKHWKLRDEEENATQLLSYNKFDTDIRTENLDIENGR